MNNGDDYLYYIVKEPYDNKLKDIRSLPAILKAQNTANKAYMALTDPSEGEGPFSSLYELKKKSVIFNEIKLQKHKDKISKGKNIETIKLGLLTPVGQTFEKAFFDSFTHITIGKISNKKLKGVHFYDPDKIQIVERFKINIETGVWSAKIKKQNEDTGEWVEKEEVTNFFPEDWSEARTFWECNYAYENRVFESGKSYNSKTLSGIKVKFIIDQENKVITFYPEIDY